jgi:CDP-diacylglycerol--glycerol-3-phosphate 3-phosphatidyltransferase
MKYLTWPNAISALRLPLAVAFAAVESAFARGAVLAAAAFTDWLDGYVARHSLQDTRSGELVDPIADKIFLVVALGGFAAQGRIELWELLLLLARDLYTVAAFVVAIVFGLQLRFRARWAGKVATGVQIGAVLVLLLDPMWISIPAIIAGLVNLWAIVDYTLSGVRSLRRADGRR